MAPTPRPTTPAPAIWCAATPQRCCSTADRGTLGPLQEAIDLAEVSAIVATHCHPDHWLELPVIRNVFIWFVPRSDVPVYGTAETRAMDRAITVMRSGRTDPLRLDRDRSLVGGDHR